jgi:cytochrome b pre-mRNA-processing protein 3
MIFKSKSHDLNLYNILLTLSRNIFFYQKIKLPDTFETRIYLMFAHFSILMIITKKKGLKFSQKSYDELFHNIEYNLRESGFGDVTVNKKMKELSKTLYDILLKIDLNSKNKFTINDNLLKKYFNLTKDENKEKLDKFSSYFNEFFNFCFELPVDSMLKDADKFNH